MPGGWAGLEIIVDIIHSGQIVVARVAGSLVPVIDHIVAPVHQRISRTRVATAVVGIQVVVEAGVRAIDGGRQAMVRKAKVVGIMQRLGHNRPLDRDEIGISRDGQQLVVGPSDRAMVNDNVATTGQAQAIHRGFVIIARSAA